MIRKAQPTGTTRIVAAALVGFLLSSCTPILDGSIWNGADLEKWVRAQALKQGCAAGSIDLAEWYEGRGGKNIWPGRCVNSGTGQSMVLAIGVDEVWKPSGS